MFSIGDVVINISNGNKMTINDINSNIYECIWYDFNLRKFVKEKINKLDLVDIDEYKRLLVLEKRNSKIDFLLK